MDKEIIEGNKIIAEFIGERTERPKNIEAEKWQVKLTSPDGTIGYWPYGHLPPFHSSYDWIMPVIEKIYLIREVKLTITPGSISIKYINGLFSNDICISDKTGLECWFIGVVEFINWYNKNKQDGK